MIRLFVPADLGAGLGVIPSLEQTRYLTGVMRKAVGDDLLLFNGRDGEWRAEITEVSKRGCRLVPVEQTRPQVAGPDLDLVIALVKRGPLETIIEKATELGVRRIRPVSTQRSNTSADRVNLGRLDAIAMEAAEQTGRLDIPAILDPEKLTAVLGGWEGGRRLMFCDETGGAPLPSVALAGRPAGEPWTVLIGPEGGFAPEETERLKGLDFVTPVSLGPRILRADTAAISALTLWQALLGDWPRG